MEKISGILPSSARLKSVDLSGAQAIRPGVPSFGAPQGISSLAPVDRVSFQSLAQPRNKPEKTDKVDVVSQLTERFFSTRVEPPPAEAVTVPQQIIVVLPSDEVYSTDPFTEDPTEFEAIDETSEPTVATAPEEVGSQLDIYA